MCEYRYFTERRIGALDLGTAYLAIPTDGMAATRVLHDGERFRSPCSTLVHALDKVISGDWKEVTQAEAEALVKPKVKPKVKVKVGQRWRDHADCGREYVLARIGGKYTLVDVDSGWPYAANTNSPIDAFADDLDDFTLVKDVP